MKPVKPLEPVRRRLCLSMLPLLAGASLLPRAAAQGTAPNAAVERLREFSRDVQGGEAPFTQTVTSADGQRRKVSQGTFAFARPNRFRFAYQKPYEQLIVSDGQKVWVYDADLNQATSRPLAKALGQTPAALLAGAAPERDFNVTPEAAAGGLDWLRATPKVREGATFQHLRVAFRGKVLAAVEITDNFGQRSLLEFGAWAPAPPAAERFRFTPPAGAEVVEQ